jgi:starch synthase
MTEPSKMPWVVANPIPSPSDAHAAALHRLGLLDRQIIGGRTFPRGVPREKVDNLPFYIFPEFGAAHLTGSRYAQEWVRFRSSSLFDFWARRRFPAGRHILAGFGYLNKTIPRVKEQGGLVFLDARNTHPSSFWRLVAEEHVRWDVMLPPIDPRHHLSQLKSLELADYIFVPSRFVEQSFLDHGCPREKLLRLPYPVDISLFRPPEQPRPRNRPLTLASSGLLSLRKGAPYLFEAIRLIREVVPDVRVKLVCGTADSFRSVFKRNGYDRIPVEWVDYMNHKELAAWLREADVYLLPTIEEGMVRSSIEALACGCYVVTTPHAGVDDYIVPQENGAVVPIRDARAIADAVLSWWATANDGEHERSSSKPLVDLGFDAFTERLANHLEARNIP